MEKDTLISFKSVNIGADSKGRDRFQLSLSKEMVGELIGVLTALSENERGAKLDIHVGDKTSETGRTFKSGFMFTRAIQDPPVGGFAARPATTTAPATPVVRGAPDPAIRAIREKLAAKKQLV